MEISQLGNLNAAEPLDLSIYKQMNQRRGIPPAAEYEVVVPETFSETNVGKTQEGNLKFSFDGKIASGDRAGFPIRFVSISTKVYEQTDFKTGQKTGKKLSQLGEYLAAMGETECPTDPQDQADAFERTAGRTARVYADWEAKHSASGYKVKGMKNFPIDPTTGERQPFVVLDGKDGRPQVDTIDPTTGESRALRLRANLNIRKWISQ